MSLAAILTVNVEKAHTSFQTMFQFGFRMPTPCKYPSPHPRGYTLFHRALIKDAYSLVCQLMTVKVLLSCWYCLLLPFSPLP